jgi:hypothetical protein
MFSEVLLISLHSLQHELNGDDTSFLFWLMLYSLAHSEQVKNCCCISAVLKKML